jgi:hypothetical protein
MVSYLGHVPRQLALFDSIDPLTPYPPISDRSQTYLRQHPRSNRRHQRGNIISNYDTQHGQALSAPIEDFFTPLAYAFILLREKGYPVVFYSYLYGISGPGDFQVPICEGQLERTIIKTTN